MATAITAWHKLISPFLPGCPNPVMTEYLRETLRDFCEETKLWDNNVLTAISLVANQPTYALTHASGEIVHIDHAEMDEVPMQPTSIEILNRHFVNWRHSTTKKPQYYFMPSAGESIQLVYTPSENLADALVVWVSLKPLEAATTVEDFLWSDYRYAIRDGALGQLLQIPNKPWSNPDIGFLREQKYEAARATAKNSKLRGRTHLDLIATEEGFAL